MRGTAAGVFVAAASCRRSRDETPQPRLAMAAGHVSKRRCLVVTSPFCSDGVRKRVLCSSSLATGLVPVVLRLVTTWRPKDLLPAIAAGGGDGRQEG